MQMHDRNSVHVILIDDNEQHLELLSLALQDASDDEDHSETFQIETYLDAADALASLPTEGPVAILCDYHMPGGSGLDWLGDLLRPNLGPVLLLTSKGDENVAASAFREGASDYLVKSKVLETPRLLRQAVRDAMRRFHLLTRNHELSRELKGANSQLEKQNVLLGELTETAHRFVDDVAHEFRTPLAVIMEFASILSDELSGPVNEEQSEYLSFIKGSARDLSQLVDDFLDSSKIKSKSLYVKRQNHKVSELFEAVRPMLQCRATTKNIKISEEISPDIQDVFIDIEKAGRIIVNLAVNAIKFSPNDSEVIIKADNCDEGCVRISVVDQGPGLSPEETQSIFDRFKQVGDVHGSTSKGFGLGLNIARELVQLNLGTVNVESEKGKGSVFSFTVPCKDRKVILNQYLNRITDEGTATAITLLRATPVSGSLDANGIQTFMISNCHPMDLVLLSEDKETVLALGITGYSQKWIERLHSVQQDRISNNPDEPATPFELSLVGTWTYPSQLEVINSHVLGKGYVQTDQLEVAA